MRAAIISIGDELTLGQNIDTNSPWIAARLAERSILTIAHHTVADDRAAIANTIRELAVRHDLLIITGGLGPTDDDLTREALGDVLTPGREMVTDEAALKQIISRFRNSGREMPAMNRKQAQRPATMRLLPNANGTAPGLVGEMGSCTVLSLPGPPREMQPMFLQWLSTIATEEDQVILSGSVHEIGMGESDAAQRLGSLMDRARNPLVGITVSDAIVSARIRASGPANEATQKLRDTMDEIERLWHPYTFGRNGVSLAESAGSLLRQAQRTLATAESCTGGWLGKLIVDVPGSSDYYRGGWITYSNAMKQSQLGVPASLLEAHGAVSEPVARAMAEEALRISGADEALSITGIAGPARNDAPSEKPVGTVFIGLTRKTQTATHTIVRHFQFPGDRFTVRDRSAKAALQMLRFALMNQPDNLPMLWESRRAFPNASVALEEAQH